MAKSIQLTKKEWQTLYDHLRDEHPASVMLLRSKMKQRLGFVDRLHRWNEPYTDRHGREQSKFHQVVMLDFYSDAKHTWFLLKYSDFINELENG